jgi:2-(1,2-epoxy-1,2-dihydrophenyl)acetyl-CoA isomerase
VTGNPMTLKMRGGVADLTFTDAPRGNPIDGAFCARLREVADRLAGMSGVRAVLVKAEGPAFSYGGDIATFVANLDVLPEAVARWAADLNAAIVTLRRLDAPVIVAVHGICAGGMAAFVAGADIVIAADDVRFVAAYAGIGYCCDAGASVTLVERMGMARARRYLILNETIAGGAALACGLADEIVSRDELVKRADEVARGIAAGPTRAFGEMRRLLLGANAVSFDAQLALEAAALARSAGTRDAREGLTSFAEKRRPVFVGD